MTELGRSDALLLLLNSPPHLQRELHRPLHILIRDFDFGVEVEQLQKPADRLVDRVLITAREGATEMRSAEQATDPALRPQPREAFGENVADQSEMIGEQVAAHLRDVPTGEIGLDAVHQRRVVTHLRRQRTEQVTNSLLVLHVNIKIPKQHDAALSPNAIATARKLARLHKPFHDVDAVFLVERHA